MKWNFLALGLKNFLYFTTTTSKSFPEKKFLIFWKNLLYFLKKIFSYILGNGTFYD